MKKAQQVLLIGDSCLDLQHYVEVNRVNPEAPSAPLYTSVRKTASYGMVNNVNLCLSNLGIDTLIIHPDPNTSTKLRLIDNKTGNQLLRLDSEKPVEAVDISNVNLSVFDAIVISDYCKGFISNETIWDIQNRFTGPIFLDTKKKDVSHFDKCQLKINLAEAKSTQGVPPSAIITLGDKGAIWGQHRYTALKTIAKDTCGAGDAFLAGLVYGSLTSNSMHSAIEFGIVNAGISVEHNGTYQPKLKELEERMEEYYDQTYR
jgi:bifunctional ADP-heptose synthase (sugar kinase/adenylyltransferase)